MAFAIKMQLIRLKRNVTTNVYDKGNDEAIQMIHKLNNLSIHASID